MANVCGIAKKSSDAMIYHRLTPLLSSHVKKYAYAAASSTYCVSEYRKTPPVKLPIAAPILRKIPTNSVYTTGK